MTNAITPKHHLVFTVNTDGKFNKPDYAVAITLATSVQHAIGRIVKLYSADDPDLITDCDKLRAVSIDHRIALELLAAAGFKTADEAIASEAKREAKALRKQPVRRERATPASTVRDSVEKLNRAPLKVVPKAEESKVVETPAAKQDDSRLDAIETLLTKFTAALQALPAQVAAPTVEAAIAEVEPEVLDRPIDHPGLKPDAAGPFKIKRDNKQAASKRLAAEPAGSKVQPSRKRPAAVIGKAKAAKPKTAAATKRKTK